MLLRRPFQRRNFLCIQVSKLTRPDALIGDRTDAHALQAIDRMPDRFAHVSDLAVAPFLDDDRDDRVLTILGVHHIQELHVGGTRATTVNHNPFRQALQVMVVGHAENLDLVFALDLMTGMRQTGSEIAIARQQQQTLRVVVEPPNWIHVVADSPFRQQIDDRWPALRVRTADDVAPRFLEKQIQPVSGTLEAAAIDANVVDGGIGF